ncbi:MAG: HsdM family class I SAM-dependent methyltransferase, partial [Gammaproteobacteria bacterium]
MESIEADYESLRGVLPKGEYQKLDNAMLGELLRTLDPEELKKVSGDVFGRIYEYFLTRFADQKAHDSGEFFTPISLVSLIAHVLDPERGTVMDPACGSGGMFVQSARLIEEHGQSPADKLTFRGLEKNATTIRLAKMNLAVHGLEGDIRKAITYYEDPQEMLGKADYLMANPPFNVDEIDADKVKANPRLAFGLPGVNKKGKVSNGNYIWISYFWSYLNARGRAGFVMSSQASSAGRGEKDVRQKLVETGDADVMIAIRSNFFYTRTVPCELWFLDRAKPEAHKDKVLMLDARNIYRKVTRKIYDFSPEQMQNLVAVVWLYHGERARFLGLVRDYLGRVCAESAAVPAALEPFVTTLADLHGLFSVISKAADKQGDLDAGKKKALADTVTELGKAATGYKTSAKHLRANLEAFRKTYENALPQTNAAQHKVRDSFEPNAKAIRDLVKRVDLAYKQAARAGDLAADLKPELLPLPPGEGRGEGHYNLRAAKRRLKQLDAERKAATEQLKRVNHYFHQVIWLQDRFPDAELADVPGLVKLVDRKAIEAAD